MSVFDTQETNTETNTSQQTETTLTEESFVGKLVQARGEQWSNPEVIARGKLEADEHIVNLEKQLEDYRTELGKQDFASDLLNKLQERDAGTTKVAPEGQHSESGTTQGNTSPEVSEDQIKSLVEQTITARDKQATVTQNLTDVQNKLKELYGDEGNKAVQEKAKQLGVSLARMEELASESPTAFLSLLGEAPKETKDFTKSTIRSESVTTEINADRNSKFYRELRRSNRNQYYSPAIQRQMMEDRKRLGDQF